MHDDHMKLIDLRIKFRQVEVTFINPCSHFVIRYAVYKNHVTFQILLLDITMCPTFGDLLHINLCTSSITMHTGFVYVVTIISI